MLSKPYVLVSLQHVWQVSHVEAGMCMLDSCMYKKVAVVKQLGNEQKHTHTHMHTHAQTGAGARAGAHAHARVYASNNNAVKQQ